MEKTEALKDGKKVTIRPLTLKDLDKLMAFYKSLPPEDRKYLRVDVTDRKVVAERIPPTDQEQVFRIIALYKDKIVADGALELSGEEWRRHQGEVRLIVARPFRRKGLGMIMIRELYFLAAARNVATVVAKMMRPQKAAQTIFHRLGFREEALLPDYVKDLTGRTQDLLIMIADLGDMWSEVDHFYSDSDWERCR
ncbi:MAG: GCN5-related N-acetyltransferase [Candidatus Aminicenantes bacterium]|jgi:L-amino acid N-acyltransferase YncA|nr:GCN5-related N-acetyltransferase [Candidatus Aminicenantes bacterium]